jgi:aerobic carbon-monoxide dehydrogenase medium subunit
MYAFDYRRPHSLNEADLAFKAMPGAKLLAGGQTLIPTMKNRLARPENLIDLGGIAGLDGISKSATELMIGAMATHASVTDASDVKSTLPGLAKLAAGIGDPHVRNRGTIGGSIANNDPAADYPAAMLALGATIHTDKRAIPADQFFTGLFMTALEEQEIIVKIHVPLPQKFAYAKFANPASRYALVGVAVAQGPGGTRIAVTGAGDNGVFRATTLEDELKAGGITGKSLSTTGLMSDIHADAAYRAHLIGVMAKRAVAALA